MPMPQLSGKPINLLHRRAGHSRSGRNWIRKDCAMRFGSRLITAMFLMGASTAFATPVITNCALRSLAKDVASATPGSTIVFTGNCIGPVVITADNVTLVGTGAAVIDGGGSDGVTVSGAHGVKLANFVVNNAANGIVVAKGAAVSTAGIGSEYNAGNGMVVRTGSNLVLGDGWAGNNGVAGLDAENGSAVEIAGSFSANSNHTHGVLVTASSLAIDATGSLSATLNAGEGLHLQYSSVLVMDHHGALSLTSNQGFGLSVDDSHASVWNGLLTSNLFSDLYLSFGTHAEFVNSTATHYSCDATVIARGNLSLTCPH